MSKISILIIGSEILKAITQDTNSNWICNYLTSLGHDIHLIQTIDDNPKKIKESLSYLWANSDLLIVTGGLGPTRDDLTKETIADYFNLEIKSNSQAIAIVKENYNRTKKPWNPENGYNFIPDKFTAHNNPEGLAPILSYSLNKKSIILLPGVPREVQAVCFEVLPLFLKQIKNIKKIITIQTHHISEEKIFFSLCPNLWNDVSSYGELSCLPTITGVKLTITIKDASDEQKVYKLIKRSKLSEFVWQYGDKSLADFIVKQATLKKKTFSFAESCTGGLCANLITDISGSSQDFMGSAVTYSNQSKIDLLNVSNQTIEDFGAVSKEVATEMANGSLRKYKSDIAVSFTGIAGPTGGSLSKPIGTVAIAIATKEKCTSQLFNFKGDRKILKQLFLNEGFHQLLKVISKS